MVRVRGRANWQPTAARHSSLEARTMPLAKGADLESRLSLAAMGVKPLSRGQHRLLRGEGQVQLRLGLRWIGVDRRESLLDLVAQPGVQARRSVERGPKVQCVALALVVARQPVAVQRQRFGAVGRRRSPDPTQCWSISMPLSRQRPPWRRPSRTMSWLQTIRASLTLFAAARRSGRLRLPTA